MTIKVTFRDSSGRYTTIEYHEANVIMKGQFVCIQNTSGYRIIPAERLVDLVAKPDGV